MSEQSQALTEFSRRLSDDWKELADALGVRYLHRKRFESGREAQDLIEWLRVRRRLLELEGALLSIEREDLVDLARKIANNQIELEPRPVQDDTLWSDSNMEMLTRIRPPSIARPVIPPLPDLGFIERLDRHRKDLAKQIGESLWDRLGRPVALWGPGGVGKTTLAAKLAREAPEPIQGRVVWIDIDSHQGFTFPQLLDRIGEVLGHPEVRRLPKESKAERVRELFTAAPSLIVFDGLELLIDEDRVAFETFLSIPVPCYVLITTRERFDAALSILVPAMQPEEARELVTRFINQQAHDADVFNGLDYDYIIKMVEGNPLVLQWVLAQIDLAQRPADVIEALRHGEGSAAERVFTRSFNLPQLGNDGRCVLLALTLFKPSASRGALVEVAGFGNNIPRLNKKALRVLSSLWLIKSTQGNERVTIEGLTRDMASSQLAKLSDSTKFWRRFIVYFTSYAERYRKWSINNQNALELEKDNILTALTAASERGYPKHVMRIAGAIFSLFHTRGFWMEAIKSSTLAIIAADHLKDTARSLEFMGNLADIQYHHGNLAEARRLYTELVSQYERGAGLPYLLGASLHQLGLVAQAEGNLKEAKQLFQRSLKVHSHGTAPTLHQLGQIAIIEGDLTAARNYLKQSYEMLVSSERVSETAECLESLGNLHLAEGHFDDAATYFGLSLEAAEKTRDIYRIASVKKSLAALERWQGNHEEATFLLREAVALFEQIGSPDARLVQTDLDSDAYG